MLYHLHSLVIEDPANDNTSFVVTDENKKVLTYLKYYLARIPGEYDYRKGIAFNGSVGTGKTMILEMIKRCIFDLWAKELTIFTAPYIKDEFYREDHDRASVAHQAKVYPFLGINDIGLERATVKGDELIRDVLYERFERRLYTFITTNLSVSQLYRRYEYNDAVGRMTDRFKHMFNYVKLSGASFR